VLERFHRYATFALYTDAHVRVARRLVALPGTGILPVSVVSLPVIGSVLTCPHTHTPNYALDFGWPPVQFSRVLRQRFTRCLVAPGYAPSLPHQFYLLYICHDCNVHGWTGTPAERTGSVAALHFLYSQLVPLHCWLILTHCSAIGYPHCPVTLPRCLPRYSYDPPLGSLVCSHYQPVDHLQRCSLPHTLFVILLPPHGYLWPTPPRPAPIPRSAAVIAFRFNGYS